MTTEEAKEDRDALRKYREFLLSEQSKSQAEFDKNILWLSSGALAVSFTFLKDLISTNQIEAPLLLAIAWICWLISIFSIFFSYHYSSLSLKQEVSRVDNGTNYDSPPAEEKYAIYTLLLNRAGIVFLFSGIVFIIIFSSLNLNKGIFVNGREKSTATTSSLEKRGERSTCAGTLSGQSCSVNGGFYRAACSSTSFDDTYATIRRLSYRLDALEHNEYSSFVCEVPHKSKYGHVNKHKLSCNHKKLH